MSTLVGIGTTVYNMFVNGYVIITGGKILQESGDAILLEQAPGTDALLLE